MRHILAGRFTAQACPRENLGGIRKLQGIEGAAHALHGFEVRLGEHLRHHMLLLFAHTVLAGKDSLTTRATAGPNSDPASYTPAGAAQPTVAMLAYAASPALGTTRTDTPALTSAAAAGDATALWLTGLPSLARLDVMQYRIIAVGLPLLSLGIITGAMWAKEAWGAYWQWDPKETAALFSWIVYAAYMHLHTRPEWRGSRGALLGAFGFASIVFCYLGVNIFISGLHSYKM